MGQQDASPTVIPPKGATAVLRRPELLTRLRRGGIVFPFIVLFIVLSVASGSFFTKVNLLDILDQQASTLIIAAAGTLVLIAGGIDLSVGATYALAGVTATQLALHVPPPLAILAGVAVGLVVGLVNGVIATFFRINSLIATLAMSFVVSGLAALVTSGNLIIAYSRPSFGDLARSSFLTVFTSTWTMVIAVAAIAIVLSRTTAGRYMYAAGSNAEAARLAGVRVQTIKLVTFVISGGAAALGGVIDASRVLSAQASNGETTLTFTVFAGIVVGGTSILGGEGAIWRTVVGVLFIALIGNGYDLLGLNPSTSRSPSAASCSSPSAPTPGPVSASSAQPVQAGCVAVPPVAHCRADQGQCGSRDGVPGEGHAVRGGGRSCQESRADGGVPGERDGREADGGGDGPAEVGIAGAAGPGGGGHCDRGPPGELGYQRVDGGRVAEGVRRDGLGRDAQLRPAGRGQDGDGEQEVAGRSHPRRDGHGLGQRAERDAGDECKRRDGGEEGKADGALVERPAGGPGDVGRCGEEDGTGQAAGDQRDPWHRPGDGPGEQGQRAEPGQVRPRDLRVLPVRAQVVHTGFCVPGWGWGPGLRGGGRGTLGIRMPSAAASWASVVRSSSQMAHALVRTWLTFRSGSAVMALASRYPTAVSCGPDGKGPAAEPG